MKLVIIIIILNSQGMKKLRYAIQKSTNFKLPASQGTRETIRPFPIGSAETEWLFGCMECQQRP